MLSKKKVLIAMGSFKDVFSPLESKNLIKNILLESNYNFDITTLSIADGGEYSHEVVKDNLNCIEINLKNIISAHKKKVDSGYLLLDSKTAFISSSHILRLNNEDDKFKNPLNLTSFGLGQLIKHAVISNKVSTIYIGLGGTNTADAGIGMLQALGINFLDKSNNQLFPNDENFFSGIDLIDIEGIDARGFNTLFSKVNIISLCDANIGINEMSVPNNQKISTYFDDDRQYINSFLDRNIYKYCVNVKKILGKELNLKSKFFGVAGGINISLNYFPSMEMSLGINFFIDKLNLKKHINESDLVITGEGKFDNSLTGKAPVGICQIAKKYNKEVLYLVGDVGDEYNAFFKNNIAYSMPPSANERGISTMISCHNFNKNMLIPLDKKAMKLTYRENTEIVFKESIIEYLHTQGW